MDREKELRFASLSGKFAKENVPAVHRRDLDTLIFLDNGKIFKKSEAIAFILIKLRRKSGRVLLWVPGVLRDSLYDMVARSRFFISKAFMMSSDFNYEKNRERFLD